MARCFAILILSLLLLPAKAQESVLHTGNWFKIAVDHDGVYRINIDAIKKMGFNPDKIDPRNIKIYGNAGGMLPQENSAERTVDLMENAIFVSGEEDGKFNKQDFILFYGKGPDASSFDVDQEVFTYEKNLYSDFNYYFITVGETNGKRMASNDNSGSNLPVINTFDDFVYHEADLNNILTSGREWFGETFKFNSIQTFTINMSGIAPGSTIHVMSGVMGRTTSGSSFNVYFNTVKIGEHKISTIANAEDYPYAKKGQSDYELFTFSSYEVSASQAQQLKYEYIKGAGDIEAYLNYFLVSSKRTLALYNDQTIFSSVESLQNTKSAFEIAAVTESCSVWEITTSGEPRIQPFSISSGKGTFNADTQVLRQFIVFNEKTPSPKLVGKVSNQNLHSLTTPNLVIVAYPGFIDQAERLAEHRQAHSGWTTTVVTTDQVFNEFSSGRQDVTAIRDFVKYLHDKNSSALKSLLLFGRASYDYKDRLYRNTNFVPTYESRNSLDPLETYSSDDYYGFLDDNEGAWEEDPSVDNTLDIGVGRFPVMNADDAKNVVDKIIDYETNLKSFGSWRKEIVFVADDGDNNAHQSQSDDLAKKVETINPAFNTHRIFLDSYPQIVKPVGTVSPETNQAITDAITRGTLIVNYTGHGGETKWAEEDIFNAASINGLENKYYPLLVTATCVYGRTDDPDNISGAENILTKSMSGAIGLVSTARPVSSNTNFELNTAFYDAVFTKESNSYLTLGEIFRRTKNNSTSGVSNRNFSLLGDPSMKLAMPEQQIAITEIVNDDGTDTLKALSTIKVRGEIQNELSTKIDNFDGTLSATLFDKKTSFTTLGNENAPYTFSAWDNKIFRGKASVKDGSFEFNFVVPKNIAYQVGQGRLSLYASSSETGIDASGANQNFTVGKSNKNPPADTTPPEIHAFMGDTTFVDGGAVSSTSYLVATVSDENGINISGYGIGNSIVGILDGDTKSFVLNDYYTANEDDFKHGRIAYQMRNLAPGKHTLKIMVWDTYNNPAEASVNFTVSESEAIHIESLGNYPNPCFDQTTIFFTHNRPGDDLDGIISITDVTGQPIKTFNFNVTESNFRVELPQLDRELDFDKKLAGGLYLVKVLVRSLTNNSKNEQVTRLIILN